MSFVKSLIFGSTTPDPTAAQTVNPFDTQQGIAGYNQTIDGYNTQKNFLEALQGQNGLQNQSSVFGQQQALAGQLQGIADGNGPNPALAQLNQTTGQNVANQAALAAGQRGASSNVGLLARQIAQQGANTQQQAAGQAATLQAQQQLAGIQALQSQQAALANQSNQMVNQQAQGVGALTQAGQQNLNLYNSAYGAKNSADVSNQAALNQANATLGASQNNIAGSVVGGLAQAGGAALTGGASAAAAVPKKYNGGMIEHFAQGGVAGQVTPTGPQSYTARFLLGQPAMMSQGGSMAAAGGTVPGQAQVAGNSPANDTVPAMLSPKEIVLPRSVTMSPNAPDLARDFVAQVLARQNMKRS